MYIFFTLLVLYVVVASAFIRNNKIISIRYFDLDLILFSSLFFAIVYFVSIYIDLNGGINSYFPGIYFMDSSRYFNEAIDFLENPLLVNELKGVFKDYNVTPKMGLSSLIANINFFRIKHEYFIYAEYILISLALTVCNYFYLRKLSFVLGFNTGFLFLFSFFVFVLFPIELYWKIRFLREGIVHNLYLGSFLLFLLSIFSNGRYFSVFVIYSLLIITFRPQIFFLIFLFSFLFLSLLPVWKLMILSSLFALAVLQTVSAAGMSIFSVFLGIANLEFIYLFIYFFKEHVGSIYLILLFSVFLYPKTHVNHFSRFPRIKLFITVLFILLFVIQSKFDSIRFLYPVMLMCMVLIFFIIVSMKIRRDCFCKK